MSGQKSDKDNKKISEVIKKVVSIGVGAAFMTEDAVKNVLSELQLPKDIISGLLQNAKNSKTEFIAAVREELEKYMDKVDLVRMGKEVITDHDIEVKATIRFVDKKKTSQKTRKTPKNKN